MKVPLSWIKEYIDIDLPPSQIAKHLTMAAWKSTDLKKRGAAFPEWWSERSWRLRSTPRQINCRSLRYPMGSIVFRWCAALPIAVPGLKTAFAKIGAKLDEGKITIKKAAVRGVESHGMLCSAQELGLPGGDEGIIEFGEHLKEGSDVADLYSDVIFDISLTPNLSHCQSVLGVVRELSAATGLPYRMPEVEVIEGNEVIEGLVGLIVKDKKRCPRYSCRLIRGVKAGPCRPAQQRLTDAGYRPVNNVVDATNYVLHAVGQPLHAFDFDLVQGKRIIVRTAHEGEVLQTLDDKLRVLTAEDLVICDMKGPIALAGVMGGCTPR